MLQKRKHLHTFAVIDKQVIAEFQKGAREKKGIKGDYEACIVCGKGRFVPANSKLRIVECEKS